MLTVLLATHNGGKVLEAVLQAYTKLLAPDGDWKLIVVDNASSDNTSSVLNSFKDRLPLTILFEGRRGKNIALNSGLSLTEGDLIVLTDDDALPAKDWLVKWRQIADENPTVSIFGGKIEPYWETPPPDWVLAGVPMGIAFVITPEDLAAGDVNPGMVWGPNMAVRNDIFVTGLRFNEKIGPSSGNYVMGSETEFNRRVSAMGHKCMYFPEVIVQHFIRTYQFKEEWLLGRAYRHGKMVGQMSKPDRNATIPKIAGYPRWMLIDFVRQVWRLAGASLRNDVVAAFRAKWRIKEIQGYFSEFQTK